MEWNVKRELKIIGILIVMFVLVVCEIRGILELIWLAITGQVV